MKNIEELYATHKRCKEDIFFFFKEMTGFDVNKEQAMILLDISKDYIFKRQTGTTTAIIIKMLYEVLFENKKVLYIAHKGPRAKDVQIIAAKYLQKSIYKDDAVVKDKYIVTERGSILFSGTDSINYRGISRDVAYIDNYMTIDRSNCDALYIFPKVVHIRTE